MKEISEEKLAIKFLNYHFRTKGFGLKSNPLKKVIKKESKKLGISPQKATKFAEAIVCKLIEEAFAEQKK